MRITICSMGYSGYWAACWCSLASVPDVALSVFTPETEYPYDRSVLDGLSVQVLPQPVFNDEKRVADMVLNQRPDAIIIAGWGSKAFKNLAFDKRMRGVRKLLLMDSMWTGSSRQVLARFALRSYVRRLDGAIVAGERGRQFARWLGFTRDQIFVSAYGYDADAFDSVYETRLESDWPKSFCFVGRYASIKGLDCLLRAYQIYRDVKGADAWALNCFGKGVLEGKIKNAEGVVDNGFLQPHRLPDALSRQGVFVLPSVHEPWGVSLAEAAGTGLPIICSDAVASGIDCVRHMYNGYVFPAGNVERLAKGLCWAHDHYGEMPRMGKLSQNYAGAYRPGVWAERILEACSK